MVYRRTSEERTERKTHSETQFLMNDVRILLILLC